MPAQDFPEIPPIPTEIVEAAKGGRLIIFVGAGVSRLNGGPSWNDMADGLLKIIAEDKDLEFSYGDFEQIRGYDPRKKVSIAMDLWRASKKEFPDFHKILRCEYTAPIPQIYKDLYDIHACFITTNYDVWLHRLADQPTGEIPQEGSVTKAAEGSKLERRGKVIYTKAELTSEKLLMLGNVVHLHGSIEDPKEMILTGRDYLGHYQDDTVKTFIRELFSGKYVVLFVGYGLEEDEILELILRKRPADSAEEKERKYFRLFPVFAHQTNLYRLLEIYSRENCGTDLIPFNSDRQGHSQLVSIISAWSEKLRPLVREQGFLDQIRIIDEAFRE